MNRQTGKAVLETWNINVATAKPVTDHYDVLTALEYLGRLNREIKNGRQ